MATDARLVGPRRLAWIAAVLCFGVVVFGAFVRLSNAGLSCPDWPTCYGKLAWPVHADDIAHANANFERPVEVGKAWREQGHRMLAGALVLATFALAAWVFRARGSRRDVPWRAALAAAALIVFQALLGMWTVTLKLKPIVVMAHLLGGMATLALLVWIASRLGGFSLLPPGRERVLREPLARKRSSTRAARSGGGAERGGAQRRMRVRQDLEIDARSGHLIAAQERTLSPTPLPGGEGLIAPKRAMVIVAIVLVAIQIALGGWTSANYAALACGVDFPRCLGEWWPATDFRNAFVLWRGIGVDYEGGVLDGPARATIQVVHRLFAILVAGHVLALGARLLRAPAWRIAGGALVVLVIVQVLLGIGNVRLGLPLPVATLHNAGAALLLALLVAMLARLPSAGMRA